MRPLSGVNLRVQTECNSLCQEFVRDKRAEATVYYEARSSHQLALSRNFRALPWSSALSPDSETERAFSARDEVVKARQRTAAVAQKMRTVHLAHA